MKQPQSASVNRNFRGCLISRFYATRKIRENQDAHEKLVLQYLRKL